MLLTCHKFVVHDLGVDVPPTTLAEQAAQMQPHLVGLSGLLTNAYDAMHKTITLLREQGYQGPIIIGGGQLGEEVCQYVGADHWSTDAVTGVELCQRLISGYIAGRGGLNPLPRLSLSPVRERYNTQRSCCS
jgi:5-methyltetrahydrofolate--homocysteine methyltransferase